MNPFKRVVIKNMFRPHHHRTALREFELNLENLAKQLKNNNLTIRFDEVPKTEVRQIIRDAVDQHKTSITANDILSAMVTKELIKYGNNNNAGKFNLTIPIDVRRNVTGYGQKFFGNGILFHQIAFDCKQLKSDSILKLATKIRSSMPEINTTNFVSFLIKLEKWIDEGKLDKLSPFDPETGSLTTNLSKMPTQKLNFGSGAADFIFPLTVEKNSTAILANKDSYILRIAY